MRRRRCWLLVLPEGHCVIRGLCHHTNNSSHIAMAADAAFKPIKEQKLTVHGLRFAAAAKPHHCKGGTHGRPFCIVWSNPSSSSSRAGVAPAGKTTPHTTIAARDHGEKDGTAGMLQQKWGLPALRQPHQLTGSTKCMQQNQRFDEVGATFGRGLTCNSTNTKQQSSVVSQQPPSAHTCTALAR